MFLQRGGKVKNLHEPRFSLDNVALPAKKLNRSDTTHSHPHPRDDKMKWYADLDIDRYPIFEYVISIGLFVFSVYGGASMAGIEWGLPGFNKRYPNYYKGFGGTTLWYSSCSLSLLPCYSMRNAKGS